ncbi:MAG TPA: hypothetical protein VL172_05540, partial [Kofleriaceae bacterium]|nr:hypothetical protein [Kofleriaceae bacterium]
MRRMITNAALATLVGVLACSGSKGPGKTTAAGGSQLDSLMKERNLKEADVVAALKTYTPTGRMDEYYLFGSGGHSGQVVVVGLPSMRLLKYIAEFTPEPWQGYGYGDKGTAEVLAGGKRHGKQITWGDTHHPALSETAGSYD